MNLKKALYFNGLRNSLFLNRGGNDREQIIMEVHMERKLYLELCQRQAIKVGVLVEYDGVAYQPYAYELTFRPDGKIKHTEILKDPTANCLVYCRLEDVKEK